MTKYNYYRYFRQSKVDVRHFFQIHYPLSMLNRTVKMIDFNKVNICF